MDRNPSFHRLILDEEFVGANQKSVTKQRTTDLSRSNHNFSNEEIDSEWSPVLLVQQKEEGKDPPLSCGLQSGSVASVHSSICTNIQALTLSIIAHTCWTMCKFWLWLTKRRWQQQSSQIQNTPMKKNTVERIWKYSDGALRRTGVASLGKVSFVWKVSMETLLTFRISSLGHSSCHYNQSFLCGVFAIGLVDYCQRFVSTE